MNNIVAHHLRVWAGVIRRDLPKFAGAEAASTALTFALCFPILVGVVAAAVDYARTSMIHNAMQGAADSAALAATKRLSIANMTDDQVVSSAQAMALSNLMSGASSTGGPDTAVTAEISAGRTGVKVTITQTVHNVIAGIIGTSAERVTVRSSASLSGRTQLCVLVLDPSSKGAFNLTGSSQLNAPQCSAYANSSHPHGLQASGSAVLTSGKSCVVGGYDGNSANYSPMPNTGCPTHSDPLTGITPPAADLVNCSQNLKIQNSATLSPGTFCGGLEISNGANVTLAPGVYIVDGGDFRLKDTAQIHTQANSAGTAIYMHGNSGTFKADPGTTIDLSAPKTGSLAGILLIEDQSAPLNRDFHISSGNARNLLGTIYLPRGNLTIDPDSGAIADQSAYTVIVAQQLVLNKGPNVVLNAMYTSTDVPVPGGVGPSGGTVQLTQ